MFTINSELWQVVLVHPRDPLLLMPNGEFALGVCDDDAKTIAISDELHGEEFERALSHELVHAAMFSYNVELGYNEEELLAEIISIFGEEIVDLTNVIFERIKRGRY